MVYFHFFLCDVFVILYIFYDEHITFLKKKTKEKTEKMPLEIQVIRKIWS